MDTAGKKGRINVPWKIVPFSQISFTGSLHPRDYIPEVHVEPMNARIREVEKQFKQLKQRHSELIAVKLRLTRVVQTQEPMPTELRQRLRELRVD